MAARRARRQPTKKAAARKKAAAPRVPEQRMDEDIVLRGNDIIIRSTPHKETNGAK